MKSNLTQDSGFLSLKAASDTEVIFYQGGISTTARSKSHNDQRNRIQKQIAEQGNPQKTTELTKGFPQDLSNDMLKWKYHSNNSTNGLNYNRNRNYNNNSNNEDDAETQNHTQHVVNSGDTEGHPSESELLITKDNDMNSVTHVSHCHSPVKRISKKDEELTSKETTEIKNVMEVVNSLKIQVDDMKTQLETSASNQHSLEQEVEDLRLERATLLRSSKPRTRVSLRRIAIANSSQSSPPPCRKGNTFAMGGNSSSCNEGYEEDRFLKSSKRFPSIPTIPWYSATSSAYNRELTLFCR